ncbi:hypothetical protein Q4Q35_02080 [Flavivirga aquimarina]|uniref:Uncharacterized protein n=1 Tax=Flavivirga aquimarina TaxID=2027862 RepID=A0ABT8W641_9FLAO|nr:hypothetical protein [Flavivirga aquimarina]MDO5968584.1 hypothetical protein [Flavivirga aquimarina]
MKALKITLFVAVLFATLASCTKQDLNEDDVLQAGNNTSMPAPSTGGKVHD